jgi:DNA repair exonuclease SbcCD nuclease subunit
LTREASSAIPSKEINFVLACMQDKSIFRFAHISDLHFSRIFFNPAQFFSKRWIGNLNLLLNRKKNFNHADLYTLIPLFQELQVDTVLLTGDLTTTSHYKEFEMAKKYVDALAEAGLKVFLIPGNHDHYTRAAYQNLEFYRYFNSTFRSSDPLSFFSLKEDKIAATYLGKEWWLMAIDCAEATSLFSSHGVFTEHVQRNLEHALSFLSSDQKVILINHFPLFEADKKKSLYRCEELRDILQRFPQIKLYLHGHTHRHIIADLRPSQLPIIVDSGSRAQKQGATWNLIDIAEEGCAIAMYKKCTPCSSELWTRQSPLHFTW